MGRRVDLDDLIDATEVARMLNLSTRNVVYVYRRRYPNFPAPVLGSGKGARWLRSDVARWARERRTPGNP